MVKELKSQSIVILAESFNTSIFNMHWLLKNSFVHEDDVLPSSIFAPNFTQVITKRYNLIVVPEQLQFSAILDSSNFDEDIKQTLLPIIQKLQEIPYKAIGLNLNWFIKDDEKSIQTLSKELFFIPNSRLFEDFVSGDPRFGAYLSKKFKNTRLKLNIKPVFINLNDSSNSQELEHIFCNFNFHLDLKDPSEAFNELIETLNCWNEFKKESNKIINLL